MVVTVTTLIPLSSPFPRSFIYENISAIVKAVYICNFDDINTTATVLLGCRYKNNKARALATVTTSI